MRTRHTTSSGPLPDAEPPPLIRWDCYEPAGHGLALGEKEWLTTGPKTKQFEREFSAYLIPKPNVTD